MSGFTRGLVAVPLFLLYAAVAFMLGGTGGLGGVALLALGALGAGYLVGSPWALLVAVPFALYGAATIDEAGPLENTDSGWGLLVLLMLALPVAVCAVLGILLRGLVHPSRLARGGPDRRYFRASGGAAEPKPRHR